MNGGEAKQEKPQDPEKVCPLNDFKPCQPNCAWYEKNHKACLVFGNYAALCAMTQALAAPIKLTGPKPGIHQV